MKICFMGSPKIAAAVLKNILVKYDIESLYTKPPAPKKRGLKLSISKAHEEALLNNIKVFHPKNFRNDEVVEEFLNQEFDLAIVVAYGLILPKKVFNAPKFGTINLHGSLLPKWRGAAPIERCIEAGDTKTGPTIMYIEEGLDSGDIIYQEDFPIDNQTTASEVYDKMAEVGSKLLLKAIDTLNQNKKLPTIKQNHNLATYAKMLKKEEGKINFNQPAQVILRKINAFEIFPSSYFNYKEETLKIIKANIITKKELNNLLTKKNINLDKIAIGDIVATKNSLYIKTVTDFLEIKILQRSGRKALPVNEFLKGYNFN